MLLVVTHVLGRLRDVTSTNKATHVSIRATGAHWGGKDVLLSEHALDDTRAALDRLKIARVDGNNVDLAGRLGRASLVLNIERELKGEVAHERWGLASLEHNVTAGLEKKGTARKSKLAILVGRTSVGTIRGIGIPTPLVEVHLKTVTHGHAVELLLAVA